MDDFLASNSSIITFLAITVGGISSAIKVANFFIWRVKAKRSLSKNEFMPYNNYKQLKRKNIFSNLGSFGMITLIILALINENIQYKSLIYIFCITSSIWDIYGRYYIPF